MRKSNLNHRDTEGTEKSGRRVLLFLVLSVSLWFNSSSFAADAPIVGRPADFSGAIGGPFVVSANIEPNEIAVEQPFVLTLRIVGPGNLRELPRPTLGKLPAFQPFAVDDLDDEYKDGPPPGRVFRYRLRPRTADVREVPAIRFVYFNPAIVPASRGYQTTYTEPARITVRAASKPEDLLPAQIAALRNELLRDPLDAAAQTALMQAREQVAYPSPDMRPGENNWPKWISLPRMSWLTVGAFLLALAFLKKWVVVRNHGWLIGALTMITLAAIPLIGNAIAWRERARNEEAPVQVLAHATDLRRGNGELYPSRLNVPLPAGAEVRRLFERNGWLQVELANGVLGWVPQKAIIENR